MIAYHGYRPGAIGRITELHAAYYQERWGFGLFFEAKVARELAEFLGRLAPERDGLWTAWCQQRLEGSIAIDGVKAATEGAHLRWFIVSPALQGRGVGTALLEQALAFCRRCGYHRVYLWTFEGLHAARHLYEKFGFKLAQQQRGRQWGTVVEEQQFVLEMS